VSLLERLRRLWSSPPPADHPLSESEREEDRWSSSYDENARTLEGLAGGDFDPDDDPASR
jgi:hypothetical protein